MSEAYRASHQASGYNSYLSDAQLRFFRDRLQSWRRELCQRLTGRPDDALSERFPDWVDSASLSTQTELSLVDRERCLGLIGQIDAALARIASGTYGLCTDSGEEIGVERLMVLPTAQYCVDAQHDIERQRRRFR